MSMEDRLISAATEPWRIDRDAWKACAEAAEAERDAWREKVENPEIAVKRLLMEGGKLDAVIEPSFGSKILAANFLQFFTEEGATNYLDVDLIAPTEDGEVPLTVTIQRRDKPNAHELRRRAEAQVVALREALREIEDTTISTEFKASSEWEIYQELARVRGDIAARALLESRQAEEEEPTHD